MNCTMDEITYITNIAGRTLPYVFREDRNCFQRVFQVDGARWNEDTKTWEVEQKEVTGE